MIRTLVLPLKEEYFAAIRDGTKLEEYRTVNCYWTKRLWGRRYDQIELTLGYPKAGDTTRRLIRPWKGVRLKWLNHPHFGPLPVFVYAFDVSEETQCSNA